MGRKRTWVPSPAWVMFSFSFFHSRSAWSIRVANSTYSPKFTQSLKIHRSLAPCAPSILTTNELHTPVISNTPGIISIDISFKRKSVMLRSLHWFLIGEDGIGGSHQDCVSRKIAWFFHNSREIKWTFYVSRKIPFLIRTCVTYGIWKLRQSTALLNVSIICLRKPIRDDPNFKSQCLWEIFSNNFIKSKKNYCKSQ